MNQNEFFGIEGVVPGSSEEIAERRKAYETREAERLIDEMSEDFPSLGRIYGILKSGGKET